MPPSIPGSASAELAVSLTPLSGFLWRPTFGAVMALPSGKIGLVLTGFTLATALAGPFVASVDPLVLSGASLVPPSLNHPMGTDALGRDLFSGVLHGARTSLLIAGAVSGLAFAIGVGIGMVSGYRGGMTDDVLMRITELFQVLPRFFLVIVAIALFGSGLDKLVITLGLTSWPVLARVVRGEVIAMRNLDFIRAAEATGASAARILWRQLLPNILPGTIVLIGLLFGQVLLVEASLGFLGLGDPNAMSWGVLAGEARRFLRVAWWLPLFPGLAITFAVLGFNLLADAFSAVLTSPGSKGPSPVTGQR